MAKLQIISIVCLLFSTEKIHRLALQGLLHSKTLSTIQSIKRECEYDNRIEKTERVIRIESIS